MSDFLSSDEQSIIQSQKVALRGKKTAKQAHKMRKVRVHLYFGRSFDRNDTAPVMICVNHASSSCYIPIPGVRIKRNRRYVNKFNGRKKKKSGKKSSWHENVGCLYYLP